MTEDADALDLDEKEPTEKSSSLKWVIIGSTLAVVLGAGAYFFFFSGASEVVESNGDNASQNIKTAQKNESATEGEDKKTKYFNIEDELIVKMKSNDDIDHYIRTKITIVVESESSYELVSENASLIKNELISLFTKENHKLLLKDIYRVKLRAKALNSVKDTLISVNVTDPNVKEVLFTDFVME